MFALEWWHWIVAGIALVIAELLVPTFFILWFGLGALLVGALLWLVPSLGLELQIFIWTLASVAMVWLWFRIFKPNLHKTRAGMSDGSIVGEVGLLAREVTPFSRGEVRFQKPVLGADSWGCIADDTIPAGERVRVVSLEGTLLKVQRIKGS